MMMIKELIFMLMLASGQVQPMHEQNDGHELYVLFVENDDATEQKDKVFCFEHAYKEEIFEFIETGTFEYNEFLLTENK